MNARKMVGMAVAAMLLAGAAARGGIPPAYSVTVVHSSPPYPPVVYPRLDARGLNNYGAVVGHFLPEADNEHAFLWEGGQLRDLGSFGRTYAEGRAINDRGWIVGSIQHHTPDEPVYNEAFLWHDGAVTFLGAIGWPGRDGQGSFAFDINNSGQIVGDSTTGNTDPYFGNPIRHGFLWENEQMTDIGTMPGFEWSHATAINAAGVVVGYCSTHTAVNPEIPGNAFLWTKSGGFVQLPNLGQGYAFPADINDRNQAVGVYRTEPFLDPVTHEYNPGCMERAILWDEGGMTDLGTLGGDMSYAMSINNAGVVVGQALADGEFRPFVWYDGIVRDVNELIPSEYVPMVGFMSSVEINDAGQILVDFDGAMGFYGYLLTPIPEPGTLLLLALGALVAVKRRRSR